MAEDLARNKKLDEQECPDITELLQYFTDAAKSFKMGGDHILHS